MDDIKARYIQQAIQEAGNPRDERARAAAVQRGIERFKRDYKGYH